MKAFFFGCLLIFLLLRGMRELKEYSPHKIAEYTISAATTPQGAEKWGLYSFSSRIPRSSR